MSYTLMIGVGAQKSGTTWLHTYLSRHPQCAMSRIKELHFWNEMCLPEDDALARRYYSQWLLRIATQIRDGDTPPPWIVNVAKDLVERAGFAGDTAGYVKYFDRRVGKARVAGEISPAYSRLSQADFQAMRACHPDVRPIFLMRDPVDRFWAAMRSLAKNEGRVADSALIAERLAKPAHLGRGTYHITAQALDQVFGADGALLVYYEELFTEAAIARICAFLGIDPAPAEFDKRVNPGDGTEHSLRDEDAAMIYAAHRETYEWAAARRAPLPTQWQARIAQFGG